MCSGKPVWRLEFPTVLQMWIMKSLLRRNGFKLKYYTNFSSIFKDLVVVEREGELTTFWFECLRLSISLEVV